jgi:hypothetical protein
VQSILLVKLLSLTELTTFSTVFLIRAVLDFHNKFGGCESNRLTNPKLGGLKFSYMLETPQKKGYLIMEQNSLQEDNQQESSLLKERRLGWFGGIIDGEGTITIRVKERKGQSTILTPVISMVNTDKLIIDMFVDILKEYEIPHWITYYDPTDKWRGCWAVQISGLKRCKKALPVFKDYLVAKKELAEIVLDWCNSRISRLGKREYYSEKDLEIVRLVKSKHGHKLVMKSSETIR